MLTLDDLMTGRTQTQNSKNMYYDIKGQYIDNMRIHIPLRSEVIDYNIIDDYYEVSLDAVLENDCVYYHDENLDTDDLYGYYSFMAPYEHNTVYLNKEVQTDE